MLPARVLSLAGTTLRMRRKQITARRAAMGHLS